MKVARVVLRDKQAGPVVGGHPWVFAQAVARVEGEPQAGDEVRVETSRGRALGRGLWSPHSAIPVRLLTHDPEQALTEAFFATRVAQAIAHRRMLGLPGTATTGCRLIHAEGDGLAGLVVDVFGDALVVQLGTIGMHRRRALILETLRAALSPAYIHEVAHAATQAREGFEAPVEPTGDAPALRFLERGLRFELPASSLQKTGYYFDQREHRESIEALSTGRRVLDACCYVGAFAMAAARGGASEVMALDSSQPALTHARRIAEDNHLEGRITFARADVRQHLERLHAEGERFDLVILDPPKLVPTARHLERGRRAYRHLNRHALSLVEPGGLLVTCSCSAAMTEQELTRTLSIAARDAGREVRLWRVGRQGPDHPVPPGFAEGSYLKTLFCSVD